MTDITEHLSSVRERVRKAAERAGRNADEVTIVAVSKQQPADAVQAAYRAGQRHFGESYVQEAVPKMDSLRELDTVWHFIGRIQANKTRPIAERFHWVHTIDRERVARRLAEQRPFYAPPLNVLIQVNLGDPRKAGVAPEEAAELAAAIAHLPRLALRGLMTIPPAGLDERAASTYFARLAKLRDDLENAGFSLPDLSMGMSDDFEAAIAAGATLVRLGTSIFGRRAARPEPSPDGLGDGRLTAAE
ncbi:MAG: YggS family pyridoxal phosphate-dependent enzyme [Gammaproteobacteria bacterium]|nr:YggS family pyridoxal phosphate-dependent enzyme [Gammaproteobacteria bacterium]